MSLLLGIETASDPYQIILAEDERIRFESTPTHAAEPSRDLARIVLDGLATLSARPKDITSISLDVGPGKLSSVRAGVSFANALAFSLGIPIYPFNYFELIGKQARKKTNLPILCAIPAVADCAYVGLYVDDSVRVLRYGSLESTVAKITSGFAELAVAGRIRDRLREMIVHEQVLDTGIENIDARILFEMNYLAQKLAVTPVSQVVPLNDQSGIFYEGL